MKCPNCASDVPDASNFCGVCGADVREAREAAQAPAQTIAMESSEEIKRMRAELADADQATEAAPATDSDPGLTHMDAAPNPRLAETALDMAAQSSESNSPEPESKPEPKPKPKSESQATQKADQRPVIQVSAEPISPSAADGVAPEGMFRETQWFMKAQDPDHIEDIDNYEARDLADQYEDKGEQFSTQVRQAFSLNPDGTPIEGPSVTETSEVDFEPNKDAGANTKLIAGVAIAVAGIGAAVYFLF